MTRVRLIACLQTEAGVPAFGTPPLGLRDSCADVEREFPPRPVAEIEADIAARYDASCVNTPGAGARARVWANRRLRLVSRHGVGDDAVDVPALPQRLMAKHVLTRQGGWGRRSDCTRQGLSGKTSGIVGAGPRIDPQTLVPLNAGAQPLDDLPAQSDFVVLACRLDASTQHLIARASLCSIAAFAPHQTPECIVNPEVLQRPGLRSWFASDAHTSTPHARRQHA